MKKHESDWNAKVRVTLNGARSVADRLDFDDRSIRAQAEAADFTERYEEDIRTPLLLPAWRIAAGLLIRYGAPLRYRNSEDVTRLVRRSVLSTGYMWLEEPTYNRIGAIAHVARVSIPEGVVDPRTVPLQDIQKVHLARRKKAREAAKDAAIEAFDKVAALTIEMGVAGTHQVLLGDDAVQRSELLYPPNFWKKGASTHFAPERVAMNRLLTDEPDAAFWLIPRQFDGRFSFTMPYPTSPSGRTEELERYHESAWAVSELATDIAAAGEPLRNIELFRRFGETVLTLPEAS